MNLCHKIIFFFHFLARFGFKENRCVRKMYTDRFRSSSVHRFPVGFRLGRRSRCVPEGDRLILDGTVGPVFVPNKPERFSGFIFDVSRAIFAHVPRETRAPATRPQSTTQLRGSTCLRRKVFKTKMLCFRARSTTGRDGYDCARLRRSTAFYRSLTPFAEYGFRFPRSSAAVGCSVLETGL